MEIVVRMSETDALGHINNAKYFTYMEEGRLDFIDKLAFKHSKNEAFIVARTACDYLQQGFHGQTLRVQTTINKIGGKSLTLHSHIYNKETGDLIARGETIVVYFRLDLQESQQIPEQYRKKLKEHMLNGKGE